MLYFPSNKSREYDYRTDKFSKSNADLFTQGCFRLSGKGIVFSQHLGKQTDKKKNCIICLFTRLSFKFFSVLPSFATCFKLPPNV